MGREKYCGGGGGDKSSSRRVVDKETPGCMSGVFQIFDFHPMIQHPCFKPNSIKQEDLTHISMKGIEAPRNSLDSKVDGVEGASLSMQIKEEKFDIPGEIRLFEKGKDCLSTCSDNSNSPGGAKTPSLVARLMGLDLLPDSNSPSVSSSSVQVKRIQSRMKKRQGNLLEHEGRYEMSGSRSLPDTPRISSARRSADADPRLSFQINKENMMVPEELDYFRRDQKSRKMDLRHEEESRSPGHYARQIVKQAKESVSRRMGSDITNTTRNKANQGDREHSVVLKSKKSKFLTKVEEESRTPSHSPKLRSLQSNNNSNITSSNQIPKTSSPIVPKSKPIPKEQKMEKCKKANCERYTQRRDTASKPGLNEKKCKKTPLVSKESSLPSSQKAQIQAQSSSKSCLRLPSCSSQTPYEQPPPPPTLKPLHNRGDSLNNSISCAVGAVAYCNEMRYVKEILNCTGIKDTTIISFDKWFSPSHPLHPSTFLFLEQSFNPIGSMKLRSNRKLFFHLVDELLVTILKPYINIKPWLGNNDLVQCEFKLRNGSQLLQQLWFNITSFPSAKCEVLEDIDNLIDKDLGEQHLLRTQIIEESEFIVFEVEQDILDSLVHEIAVFILGRPVKC